MCRRACLEWLSFAVLAALLPAGCSELAMPEAAPAGPGLSIPAPDDVKAPPAGAQSTGSGLAWRVLTPGTGTVHPQATDVVTVNYTGWTTDGRAFDSSTVRQKPATFALDGVIAGWTEGVQLMVQGERSRFWIPAHLAYGNNPRDGRPGGMLVFDIELLAIGR